MKQKFLKQEKQVSDLIKQAEINRTQVIEKEASLEKMKTDLAKEKSESKKLMEKLQESYLKFNDAMMQNQLLLQNQKKVFFYKFYLLNKN